MQYTFPSIDELRLRAEAEHLKSIDKTKHTLFIEGRKLGHSEGRSEALNEDAQKTKAALKAIELSLQSLTSKYHENYQSLEKDAGNLIHVLFKQFIPIAQQAHKLEFLTEHFNEALKLSSGNPQLRITVPTGLKDALEKLLETSIKEQNIEIFIEEDASLTAGDCRIIWNNGRLEQNLKQHQKQIEQHIEKVLGQYTEIPADPMNEKTDEEIDGINVHKEQKIIEGA